MKTLLIAFAFLSIVAMTIAHTPAVEQGWSRLPEMVHLKS
jgi:hypothetical protein